MEIGGFFELELPLKSEYHDKALKLNTARNSLEYVLRANRYKKIFLPYYTCSSVLEVIYKLNIKFEFYNINDKFEPIFDFSNIKEDELFLYVNYFGICSNVVDELIDIKNKNNFNICIDNTQAFFIYPKGEDHTIYSARKFFGVPDGAYLYTNKFLDKDLDKESGYDKMAHLIKRIDLNAQESYKDFKENSKRHSNQWIKEMSNISSRILKSIQYEDVIDKRNSNFKYINFNLSKYNKLKFDLNSQKGPMIYPLLIDNGVELRKFLISNKIYVAQYWNEVLDNVSSNSVESDFTNNLVALPIDQRYSIKEMDFIVQLINKFNEGV